jgi:hypothetical protein
MIFILFSITLSSKPSRGFGASFGPPAARVRLHWAAAAARVPRPVQRHVAMDWSDVQQATEPFGKRTAGVQSLLDSSHEQVAADGFVGATGLAAAS